MGDRARRSTRRQQLCDFSALRGRCWVSRAVGRVQKGSRKSMRMEATRRLV